MEPLLIILAIALVAMWFMSSRQRKAQREALSFRDRLEPGQEVMTGSGLFGTVVSVEDDVVTLETSSDGTQTRWLKAAIAKLVEPPVEDEDEYDDENAEYDEDAELSDEPSQGTILNGEPLDVPDDISSLDPGDDQDKKKK